MKKLMVSALFAFLMVSVTTTSFAQTQITEEQKAEMKAVAEEYIATLELTDDQKEQFQEINAKYADKMLTLKESKGSMFAKKKEVKSIKSDKAAEIKDLLSDEQYATYESFKDELNAKQKEIINQ